MIHSRLSRSLMIGAGALAASAITLTIAPAATAAQPDSQRPERPAVDGPFVGARLVITKDGATVAHVVDGGPADVAGIAEGDIVSSIDGVKLDERGALREALLGAKTGDEIAVVVVHDGAERTVVVTLGSAADRPARPAPEDTPWVGARLVRLEGQNGVLVRSVAADGPAAGAGLVRGDVMTSIDGVAVTDWWQAREVLSVHAPGDKVAVVVDRDGVSKTLTVTLGSLDDAVMGSHAKGAQGAQGANAPADAGANAPADAPRDGSQGAARDGNGPGGRAQAGPQGKGVGPGGSTSLGDVPPPADEEAV